MDKKFLLNYIHFTLIDEFGLGRYLQGQGITTGPRISRKQRVEDRFGATHAEVTGAVSLPLLTILQSLSFALFWLNSHVWRQNFVTIYRRFGSLTIRIISGLSRLRL
jgi:hypothetical protein